MTDREKLSAIIAEIERRKETWNHQDQQYVAGGKDMCDYLLGFIDSLLNEPVSNIWHDSNKKQPKSGSNVAVWDGNSGEIKTMMTEQERKVFEETLTKEWQSYIDRGAATVDALEEDAQKLAFAKGFKAGWEKGIDEIEEKLLSEVLPCFMHGGEADEVIAKLEEVLGYMTDFHGFACV